MKLNETALEAAAQAAWKDTGHEGRFREQSANPGYWPVHTSRVVTAYLDALDAEGLADLYEYWCERIEALPVPDKIREGDLVACSSSGVLSGAWYAVPAGGDYAGPIPYRYRRVLRRARRQWKIGDLVDDTRNLPKGAVARDEGGFVVEYGGGDLFYVAGIESTVRLDPMNNPRIIWLPENEDES